MWSVLTLVLDHSEENIFFAKLQMYSTVEPSKTGFSCTTLYLYNNQITTCTPSSSWCCQSLTPLFDCLGAFINHKYLLYNWWQIAWLIINGLKASVHKTYLHWEKYKFDIISFRLSTCLDLCNKIDCMLSVAWFLLRTKNLLLCCRFNASC